MSSDYYNGIDREREKEQRLLDKCYAWWNSLSEEGQYNLMCDWYPNDFDVDEDSGDSFFGDMPHSTKIWIWQRETNPAHELTEEEVDDIVGDMECHRKMVEGDDIE